MRYVFILICCVALAGRVSAQDVADAKQTGKASLEGRIIQEPGGEPVKKAIVELIAENQEEGGNYTAISNQDGHFEIRGILPGRYRMFTERTGFIEVDHRRRRSQGISLSFDPGQEVNDQTLHMLAAAVLIGRVQDEDGDPMTDAEVKVFRRRFGSGGVKFEPVGGTQTNDLGEFRMGGLLADKYFVSVTPPVNFQSVVDFRIGAREKGTPRAQTAYVTTFYPNATDRAQAAAIELHPGEETPVEFSLMRIHTVRVRGSVESLDAGADTVVMLRAHDSNAMVLAGEVDKQGKFEIPRVAPGLYTIVATTPMADRPQSAARNIEVADADIDGIVLAPLAGTTIRGKLHFGSKVKLGSAGQYAVMHRMDGGDEFKDLAWYAFDGVGTLPPLGPVKPDGSFELKDVPPGLYEIEFSSDSKSLGGYFVDSVVVGTKDVTETGLRANGGTLGVDVMLSDGAAEVNGVTQNDKSEPIANATVVAVPEEKYRKRENHYKKSTTDQQGRFSLAGLRPGKYTLYAWEVLDGDDYLDPDFLKQFEGQGTAIKAEKGGRQTVALKVIPTAADQP
jgi:Carboxypeptidase regulatory-like domain